MATQLAQLEIPLSTIGEDGFRATMNSVHALLETSQASIMQNIAGYRQMTALQHSAAEMEKHIAQQGGAATEEQKNALATMKSRADDATTAYRGKLAILEEVTNSIQKMTGVNLGGLVNNVRDLGLKFGLIKTAVEAVVDAVIGWAKVHDELYMLGKRIEMVGGDAAATMPKVRTLTSEMKQFGVSGEQVREMVSTGLGRGESFSQAANNVRAAAALAESTGMSIHRAQMLLERYEEVGTSAVAMARNTRLASMLRAKRSEVEIQRELNNLIQRGRQLQLTEKDNTFEGQLIRVKSAMEEVFKVVGGKLGPHFMAMVGFLQQAYIAVQKIVASLLTIVGDALQPALTVMSFSFMVWSEIFKTIGQVWDRLRDLYQMLKDSIGKAVDDIAKKFSGVTSIIMRMIEGIKTAWKSMKLFLGLKDNKDMSPIDEIQPGRLSQQAQMMNADKLWEKVAMAGVDTVQGQQLQNLERMNTTMGNWEANGMPIRRPAAGGAPGVVPA